MLYQGPPNDSCRQTRLAQSEIRAPGTISGRTRLYGIVGDPIAQVASPGLFNAMFEGERLDAVLVPFHVAVDDLSAWWHGVSATRNLEGLVVTVPHKPSMSNLVDRLGERGREAGTINAIRREPDGAWLGDMFDGYACVQRLLGDARKLDGQSVLQVGTGGVGRAIAFALASAGIAAITLHDRDMASARRLETDLRTAYAGLEVEIGEPAAQDHGIIINCTPLGMGPEDPYPIDPKSLHGDMLAIDVILEPDISPFLAAARGLGCATLNGREIVEANFEAIRSFFGLSAGSDSTQS